jgi:hypothetical protein
MTSASSPASAGLHSNAWISAFTWARWAFAQCSPLTVFSLLSSSASISFRSRQRSANLEEIAAVHSPADGSDKRQKTSSLLRRTGCLTRLRRRICAMSHRVTTCLAKMSLVATKRSPEALKTGSHYRNFCLIVGPVEVSGIDGCQGLDQAIDLPLERAIGFGNVLHA